MAERVGMLRSLRAYLWVCLVGRVGPLWWGVALSVCIEAVQYASAVSMGWVAIGAVLRGTRMRVGAGIITCACGHHLIAKGWLPDAADGRSPYGIAAIA